MNRWNSGLTSVPGAYSGRRDPENGGTVVTRPDGSPLPLAPSLAIRRYSPDGFNWGYHGSGPAQLALALLLDHTEDADLARYFHQRFKRDVVATWGDEWSLEVGALAAWLAARFMQPAAGSQKWRR